MSVYVRHREGTACLSPLARDPPRRNASGRQISAESSAALRSRDYSVDTERLLLKAAGWRREREKARRPAAGRMGDDEKEKRVLKKWLQGKQHPAAGNIPPRRENGSLRPSRPTNRLVATQSDRCRIIPEICARRIKSSLENPAELVSDARRSDTLVSCNYGECSFAVDSGPDPYLPPLFAGPERAEINSLLNTAYIVIDSVID